MEKDLDVERRRVLLCNRRQLVVVCPKHKRQGVLLLPFSVDIEEDIVPDLRAADDGRVSAVGRNFAGSSENERKAESERSSVGSSASARKVDSERVESERYFEDKHETGPATRHYCTIWKERT